MELSTSGGEDLESRTQRAKSIRHRAAASGSLFYNLCAYSVLC